MTTDLALIDWSRAQFALTACYHWLFVPLTLGLAVVMGVMETLYVWRRDDFWKRAAMFWMKLFGINFAVGVATGLILEFEFGTNFSNYAWFVGDVFGAPLAIEGIVAFFMEATFIAVMFFGWNKVSRGFHLASTWLTGVGATLSAWWILVANSWMQHPVGMTFNPDTVRSEMTDFVAVAFSHEAVIKFLHTVLSGWLTGAVFVVGVSCWFLLRRRHERFARASVMVGAVVGLIGGLGVMFTGDQSGLIVARNQPVKLAMAEGLEQGGRRAPFSIVPGVEVPGLLSVLATHDVQGYVPGLTDWAAGYTDADGVSHPSALQKMDYGRRALTALRDYRTAAAAGHEAARRTALDTLRRYQPYMGYGYVSHPAELTPRHLVPLIYWAFRVMVGGGMLLMLVLALVLLMEWRGRLAGQRWLLYAGLWSVPLVYLASQCGWVVAEVGRQPWAIQDLLPVSVSVSGVSSASVITTFFLFLVLFTVLLVAEVRILCRAIRRGPEVD